MFIFSCHDMFEAFFLVENVELDVVFRVTSAVELEKQSFCDLKVANNTEHHVAFKVHL